MKIKDWNHQKRLIIIPMMIAIFRNHLGHLTILRYKTDLSKVAVDELFVENFSLFIVGDLKLQHLISGMTSFQSPDMYQFREIQD